VTTNARAPVHAPALCSRKALGACVLLPEQVMEVVAAPNFLFAATMNPGGDFGKRELSPALRNRFTEARVLR
jgi:midasin (ATPase involved in ribosome maturation)